MGIFSWGKSSKLKGLEKIITTGPTDNFTQWMKDQGKRDQALEEYLDICATDDGIKTMMAGEAASRADLKVIYEEYSKTGLANAILQTIANAKALQYVVRAKKKGVSPLTIRLNIVEYSQGKLSEDALLQQVR